MKVKINTFAVQRLSLDPKCKSVITSISLIIILKLSTYLHIIFITLCFLDTISVGITIPGDVVLPCDISIVHDAKIRPIPAVFKCAN